MQGGLYGRQHRYGKGLQEGVAGRREGQDDERDLPLGPGPDLGRRRPVSRRRGRAPSTKRILPAGGVLHVPVLEVAAFPGVVMRLLSMTCYHWPLKPAMTSDKDAAVAATSLAGAGNASDRPVRSPVQWTT